MNDVEGWMITKEWGSNYLFGFSAAFILRV